MQKTRFRTVSAYGLAAALVIAGLLAASRSAQAGDETRDSAEAKIRRGLEIAPVPLNLAGKDLRLVGLGSYIVNAQASCNDCHSAGQATLFLPGGNPYFGQFPGQVNPATYLGGGRNFGPLAPNSPNIVSRNLTPDKTGLPVGGDSFSKFLFTIRSGTDPDQVHPTCTATSTSPCLPPPFDGNALQIMPWPVLRNMTDHDLLAIYEYLAAIPCLEGGPGEPADRCH